MAWRATRLESHDGEVISVTALALADNKMHFAPCSSTTATPLTLTALPLPYAVLPLVSRQVHAETKGILERFWMTNTLVLYDHGVAAEVLAYIGERHSRWVRSIELWIGCQGSLNTKQIVALFSKLPKLTVANKGALRKLRLVYVDELTSASFSRQMWCEVLWRSEKGRWFQGKEETEVGWGDCERSIVWAEQGMKVDLLGIGLWRMRLVGSWGLGPLPPVTSTRLWSPLGRKSLLI
jgi:hypothetical protein